MRAQNLAQGVPVVMITTESSEEHVKQAIQAGRTGIHPQAVHGRAGEGTGIAAGAALRRPMSASGMRSAENGGRGDGEWRGARRHGRKCGRMMESTGVELTDRRAPDPVNVLNGVRNAAIARANRALAKREQAMAVSLRESVQLVSDPRNLDASVEEVFRLMLGVECRRDADRLPPRRRSR